MVKRDIWGRSLQTAEKPEIKTYEPLPTMRLFHSSGAKYRCIVGPVGCQPAGSLVLMADGTMKPVEDIVVGDFVVSPQGDGLVKIAKVQQIHCGPDRIFEIKSRRGPNYLCSANHIVLEHQYSYKTGWRINEELAKDIIKRRNAKCRFLPTCPPVEFPEKALPVPPYVLGAFLGDGSFVLGRGRDIGFTNLDSRMWDVLAKAGCVWGAEQTCNGTRAPSRRLKVATPFYSHFEDLGLAGKNSHQKFIPKLYLGASLRQRQELLAGLIDTDGMVGNQYKSTMEYASVSLRLIQDIKTLCIGLGLQTSVIKRRETKNGGKRFISYRIHITSSRPLPLRIKEQCLARKTGTRLSVGKYRDIGKQDIVYGFTLDSASGWFVTDHGIVTHNSGKTSAAAWEVCRYAPYALFRTYGIKKTKWAVVRNTYPELRDTTCKTIADSEYGWFPWGEEKKQEFNYILRWPEGFEVELLFRSCDRTGAIKKFKSLEITGFWIDESIEVPELVKNRLKDRVGRFPPKCPHKFGIETTNPPDVEHPTYSQFKWQADPPGPLPPGVPLADHEGFWQPPYENTENLQEGYYEDLKQAYRDYPDWVDMYILGKPGVMVTGKLVYNNFRREYHVAKEPLKWTGGTLYCGWDNSGNRPAFVVGQVVGPLRVQILREYFHDKMNIVDFTQYVVQQLNLDFPGAKEIRHWGDPAGNQQYSKKEGGFTSNATLMAQVGVEVAPSEQNLRARIESVDQMLARIEGILIDPSCTRLINGFLGGYCYPPNKSLMGEYLPNILKNKYSHVHDALQYMMVRLFKPDTRPDARNPLLDLVQEKRDRYDPLKYTGYDPFSWR